MQRPKPETVRREGDLAVDEVTLDPEGQRLAEPGRVYPSRSMLLNISRSGHLILPVTSTGEPGLWCTAALTDTDGVSYCQKEQKMKKRDLQVLRRRARDRLRQTRGKSALCQLRSILRLVPGRRGGRQLIIIVGLHSDLGDCI